MKGISTKGGGGKILSLSKHSSRPLRTQIDTRKAYKLKKKQKQRHLLIMTSLLLANIFEKQT